MSGRHPSSSSLAICQVISCLCFSWLCSANIRTLTLSIGLLPHRLTAARFKNQTFPSPPLAKQDHLDRASVSGSTQHVNETWRGKMWVFRSVCGLLVSSQHHAELVLWLTAKPHGTVKKQIHPVLLCLKLWLSSYIVLCPNYCFSKI